jgi:PncC family amidohydrolase
MSFPPDEIRPTVEKIASILNIRGQTLATSESACGGLISSYLVSVAGASSYYVGGTMTYALKSRLKLSGWSADDIKSYTGPSEDVALRLARNMKLELGSTYTLSETGWAGPTGDKVGTVYYGVAGPKQEVAVTQFINGKERSENMVEFACRALEFLLEVLEADGK